MKHITYTALQNLLKAMHLYAQAATAYGGS